MSPSDAELEILEILWRIGPATVRAVHQQHPRAREVRYNTVGKLIDIMVGKGLLARDASVRGRLVEDLARRAFGGSPAALALHALGNTSLREEEVAELRRLLDALED